MAKDKKPTRRRGRPPPDTTHAVPEARVLDCAFKSFAQRGYEGTTLRALAKQLGVSHNLLNVRFGTKEALWKRAMDVALERASAPVLDAFEMPAASHEARLQQLIERFCRWAVDNALLVSITNIEGRHASWRMEYLVDGYVRPFKDRLDALLDQVRCERPVRSISSTGLMAILVQGVGFYFASAPLLERVGVLDEIDPAALDQRVRDFADFLSSALLPAFTRGVA